MTTNELVKLTMLWTIGPSFFYNIYSNYYKLNQWMTNSYSSFKVCRIYLENDIYQERERKRQTERERERERERDRQTDRQRERVLNYQMGICFLDLSVSYQMGYIPIKGAYPFQNSTASLAKETRAIRVIILGRVQGECKHLIPVSILHKSIAGRYRSVRVADGPITARYRFINNASWDLDFPPSYLQGRRDHL